MRVLQAKQGHNVDVNKGAMMNKFMIDGYRPINKKWPIYTLDFETRKVDIEYFENQKEAGKVGLLVGTGDFREIGAWGKKKKGFFAVYVNDNSLFLWLDGQCFNLINDEVVVTIKRGVDFLLRKRFRVFVDGQQIFDCRYSYLDYEDFPDEDIFWYMARNLSDMESRFRTLILLGDKIQGSYQLTDEYCQNLDTRVKAAIADWRASTGRC